MTKLLIHADCDEAVRNFNLPDQFGFGSVMAPIMAVCEYRNGVWQDLQILPYGPITMYPTSKVLHYAQEIFEGMKAYRVKNLGPLLFRPEENFLRFNRSAERMAMPHIPKDIFIKAVEIVTSYCAEFIPRRSGESLYLRPFMFASEETLGIRPSETFTFMVIASPSGSYFNSGSLSVLVERETFRACRGGTGAAKTGGNYAASLKSAIKVKNLGYMQTLWLDALESTYVEEMSGMNFFAVINQELHTPELTDTILDGITRKSIIQLAQAMGIKVVERKIDINLLLEQVKSGICTEAFACGTAAIITPIDFLAEENGIKYPLKCPSGDLSMKLRENLLAIQEGRIADPYGWVHPVKAHVI